LTSDESGLPGGQDTPPQADVVAGDHSPVISSGGGDQLIEQVSIDARSASSPGESFLQPMYWIAGIVLAFVGVVSLLITVWPPGDDDHRRHLARTY
jgi:hypothetical protein